MRSRMIWLIRKDECDRESNLSGRAERQKDSGYVIYTERITSLNVDVVSVFCMRSSTSVTYTKAWTRYHYSILKKSGCSRFTYSWLPFGRHGATWRRFKREGRYQIELGSTLFLTANRRRDAYVQDSNMIALENGMSLKKIISTIDWVSDKIPCWVIVFFLFFFFFFYCILLMFFVFFFSGGYDGLSILQFWHGKEIFARIVKEVRDWWLDFTLIYRLHNIWDYKTCRSVMV